MARTFSDAGPVSRPPRQKLTWTWIWFVFAVLVLVLTVLGFVYAGRAGMG